MHGLVRSNTWLTFLFTDDSIFICTTRKFAVYAHQLDQLKRSFASHDLERKQIEESPDDKNLHVLNGIKNEEWPGRGESKSSRFFAVVIRSDLIESMKAVKYQVLY